MNWWDQMHRFLCPPILHTVSHFSTFFFFSFFYILAKNLLSFDNSYSDRHEVVSPCGYLLILGGVEQLVCRILVPWLGIEPSPTTAEVWSLNYWTAGKSLSLLIFTPCGFIFPWWLVVFSIFSCACWPSECLIWEKCLFIFYAHFLIVFWCWIVWILCIFWILTP